MASAIDDNWGTFSGSGEAGNANFVPPANFSTPTATASVREDLDRVQAHFDAKWAAFIAHHPEVKNADQWKTFALMGYWWHVVHSRTILREALKNV